MGSNHDCPQRGAVDNVAIERDRDHIYGHVSAPALMRSATTETR